MNTAPSPQRRDRRDDLDDSMKKSTEEEPQNYRDESTEDKQVEIGPDMTDAPIRRIDAPEGPAR